MCAAVSCEVCSVRKSVIYGNILVEGDAAKFFFLFASSVVVQWAIVYSSVHTSSPAIVLVRSTQQHQLLADQLKPRIKKSQSTWSKKIGTFYRVSHPRHGVGIECIRTGFTICTHTFHRSLVLLTYTLVHARASSSRNVVE